MASQSLKSSSDTEHTMEVAQDISGPITWGTGHFAKYYRCSRHVETRSHHVHEMVEKRQITVKKAKTTEIITDVLTKPLDEASVENGKRLIHVRQYLLKGDGKQMEHIGNLKTSLQVSDLKHVTTVIRPNIYIR